jgi:hypothetical protein
MQNNFIEEFFDSDIYQEVVARNDEKGLYVVKTVSDSVFFLERDSTSCVELHFPEEQLLAIEACS